MKFLCKRWVVVVRGAPGRNLEAQLRVGAHRRLSLSGTGPGSERGLFRSNTHSRTYFAGQAGVSVPDRRETAPTIHPTSSCSGVPQGRLGCANCKISTS
jgi:hypothetical protein